MSEADGAREKLVALRDKLAEQDPGFLEFDLDDPATALTFAILGAALKGEAVSIEAEDDDGKTETLSVEGLGAGSDGLPIITIGLSSSDGTLSPESADAAAELLRPSLEAEIDSMTREQP